MHLLLVSIFFDKFIGLQAWGECSKLVPCSIRTWRPAEVCWDMNTNKRLLYISSKPRNENHYFLYWFLFCLSSISAILSGTIGIHYGHVLIHFKVTKLQTYIELYSWSSVNFEFKIESGVLCRVTLRGLGNGSQWASSCSLWPSFSTLQMVNFLDLVPYFDEDTCVPQNHELYLEGFIFKFPFAAIPMNKQLYSFSYVCFTAGAAGIVFSAFYILVRKFDPQLSSFKYPNLINSGNLFFSFSPFY